MAVINTEKEIAAHAANISKEDLLYKLAEHCKINNCSVDRAIADFAKGSY